MVTALYSKTFQILSSILCVCGCVDLVYQIYYGSSKNDGNEIKAWDKIQIARKKRLAGWVV